MVLSTSAAAGSAARLACTSGSATWANSRRARLEGSRAASFARHSHVGPARFDERSSNRRCSGSDAPLFNEQFSQRPVLRQRPRHAWRPVRRRAWPTRSAESIRQTANYDPRQERACSTPRDIRRFASSAGPVGCPPRQPTDHGALWAPSVREAFASCRPVPSWGSRGRYNLAGAYSRLYVIRLSARYPRYSKAGH